MMGDFFLNDLVITLSSPQRVEATSIKRTVALIIKNNTRQDITLSLIIKQNQNMNKKKIYYLFLIKKKRIE